MDIRIVKAGRCIRRFPATYAKILLGGTATVANGLQLAVAGLVSVWVIREAISKGALPALINEFTVWALWGQAVLYVGAAWAIIALLVASRRVVKDERELGHWVGRERHYYEPQLVGMSVFTDADRDCVVEIYFQDAELNSLVSYEIVLHPKVGARASYYFESEPGHLAALFASIKFVDRESGLVRGGKAQGTGAVRLNGHRAYLRVELEPGTVPVTARVYMHKFEVA